MASDQVFNQLGLSPFGDLLSNQTGFEYNGAIAYGTGVNSKRLLDTTLEILHGMFSPV